MKIQIKKRGTSIIEAVIAVAIAGILLVWGVNFILNISNLKSASADVMLATHLASNRIETLKSMKKIDLEEAVASEEWIREDPPYESFEYICVETKRYSNKTSWIIEIQVSVRKKGQTEPLVRMKCNFIRTMTDGENLGV